MKKVFGLLFISILAVVLVACGGGSGDKKEKNETIKIGASPAPHAEILEEAKPLLKKKVMT